MIAYLGIMMTGKRLKDTDFSVVLFRSDFVLVSEKNHMKMHKNQWLLTPLSPLDIPCRATNWGKYYEGWGADACAVP